MSKRKSVRHRDETSPWQIAQRHCFVGWLNHQYSKAGIKPPITDIKVAFKNGVNLHKLLAFLSNESTGKYNENPMMKVQEVENLSIAFQFMKKNGMTFENLGASDIHEENYTLIMGLVWALISHYQVAGHLPFSQEQQEKKRLEQAKKNLLAWCQKRCIAHGVQVNNFKGSWGDGSAFSSLMATIDYGYNYWDHEGEDADDKLDGAFEFAETPLEIPQLLESYTMVQTQDEKSIVTYLSLIYEKYKDYPILVSERKIKYSYQFDGLDLDADGNGNAVVDVEKEFKTRVFQGNVPVDLSKPGVPVPKYVLRGPQGEEVPIETKVNPDGTIDSKFTPRSIGRHVLEMYVDGQLSGTQPINARPPHLDTSGAGLKAASVGVPAKFTATFRDKEGGKIVPPNGNFAVKVMGPEGEVPCTVTQNPDGSSSVSYVPTAIGTHDVTLFYRAKEVKNSKVEAYQLDFLDLDANGNNVATVGVLSKFGLGVRGRAGLVYPEGLGVCLTGPSGEIKCHQKKTDDGYSQFSYTPSLPGAHQLEVRIEDATIHEVGVEVNDMEIEWEGGGLVGSIVGEAVSFDVSFFDHDYLLVAPGENVEIQIQGPDGLVKADLRQNADGTTTVTYVSRVPGDHVINLLVGGHIKKTATAPAYAVDFDFSAFETDKDGNLLAVVDVPKVAKMSLTDGKGSKAMPPGMKVQLVGPNTKNPCATAPNGQKFDCTVHAIESGDSKLEVTIDGYPVYSRGVKVRDLFVEAYGPGLKAGAVGTLTEFTTIFREKPGGQVIPPRGNFVPVVEKDVSQPTPAGGGFEVSLSENADGSSRVTYTAPAPVNCAVFQVYRGQTLQRNKVPFYIIDFLNLDGLEGIDQASVGILSTFRLGVTGPDGLVFPEGLDVVFSGPSGTITCDRRELADGYSECSFTPLAPGHHKVEVLIGGSPVKGAPVQVDDMKFTFGGPGASSAVVGAECEVSVACQDGSGQPLPLPSDYEIEVCSADGPLRVFRNEGGFSYVPKKAGPLTVKVKVGGKEVAQADVIAVAIDLDCGEDKNVLVNDPTKIGASMKDSDNGAPLGHLNGVSAFLVSPDGDSVPCDISDNKIELTAKTAGYHQLNLEYKGIPFKRVNINAIGPTVFGDVDRSFQFFPARFVCEYPREDLEKEHLSVDVSQVKASGSLYGSPVQMTGKPISDYSVEFSYTPTQVGEMELQVVDASGASCLDTRVPVVAAEWTVTGSGSKLAKCGIDNFFQVRANDPYTGAPLLRSALGKVSCQVIDPTGKAVDVRYQFEPDGGLGVVFLPEISGRHQVQVLIDGLVAHSFDIPTLRYEFEGDAMMGCCSKMPASFKLEIYANEGDPPLPPSDILTSVKYLDTNEPVQTNEKRSKSDIQYSFTPTTVGTLEICVEHAGDIVYQGQPKVALPRFTFEGKGAQMGVLGFENVFDVVQVHPFTLDPIPQDKFFVRALMKDPNQKNFPVRKKTTLQGEYTCTYVPKMLGDHRVEINCDGERVVQEGVPHTIPVVDPDSLKEEELEKGLLRVFLERDEFLESLKVSSNSMIGINVKTKAGDVKRLIQEKMSKSLSDSDTKAMYKHCMWFCICEVPEDAEQRKAAKAKEAKDSDSVLKKFEQLQGNEPEPPKPDDPSVVDPEGRVLPREEPVWHWRYVKGGKPTISQVWGIPSRLYFKMLMGHLEFLVKYPKRGVTEQALQILIVIRDPSNGNCLVRDHKGELYLTARLPNNTEQKQDCQRTNILGEFSCPFVSSVPGVHSLMLTFNGSHVHEKEAKVDIYQRSGATALLNKVRK